MNKPSESFGLYCPDGRQAQLLSVQVHAEILGLMLRLTVRQTWRNASGAPMATRMRLPLSWDQTLLDLEVQRADERQPMQGVWRESRKVCSAVPGVLATGEQVTLHWRTGQLLNLQGGSLRLQLPAALVPPTARVSMLQIEVHDPVAQGTVGCTSHGLQRARHASGLTLRWHTTKGLGKDLVLTAHGLREMALAVAAPLDTDTGTCTMALSACPRLPGHPQPGQPLRLKLLVDSSSTMPAERLSQIRQSLDRLLGQLQPVDQVSYSRFGERTVHDLPRLQVCTEAYQRRLRALARHTDTDLGPASVAAAIQAVLAIPDEDEEAVRDADILLVTASPVWTIEPLMQALRADDHRLHVLAVGTAAEGLWCELAQVSGGHAETLGPGQHSLPALTRLIDRLRQQQPVQTRLVLQGADPQSQASGLHTLVDGDTLHIRAQVRPAAAPQDLTGQPQFQARLDWELEGMPGTSQGLTAAKVLWDEQGDLVRLLAARELPWLDDASRPTHIARHRLTVPDAGRVAADALVGQPGSTAQNGQADRRSASSLPSASNRTLRSADGTHSPALRTASLQPVMASPVAHVHPLRPSPVRQLDLAGWLAQGQVPDSPLNRLVLTFDAQAQNHKQYRATLSATLQCAPTPLLDGLVLHLARRAGSPARVWAMVLHWLHQEHDWSLSTPALTLLESELATVPITVRNETLAGLGRAALPQTNRQAA